MRLEEVALMLLYHEFLMVYILNLVEKIFNVNVKADTLTLNLINQKFIGRQL